MSGAGPRRRGSFLEPFHRWRPAPRFGEPARSAADRDGKQHFRRNFEDSALDLATGVWRRVTDRNWEQWRVRRADGKWFESEPPLWPEAVVPVSIPHEVLPCDEGWRRARVAVEGVPVELTVGHHEVEVVVEGQLADRFTVTPDPATIDVIPVTHRRIGVVPTEQVDGSENRELPGPPMPLKT